MRIGILTGGGDCPGLNAIIRAVVIKGIHDGHRILGFRNGWKGMLESDYVELDRDSVSGIIHRGGTILKSSRTNPARENEGIEKVKKAMEKLDLDALIAIGGDDTLGAALELHDNGLRVVGVPKTIDRDLSATETTIGFDTAINIVMGDIDRLRTTAESHNRIMVVEVMGRHSGFIAVMAGLAGGADVILIPEKPFTLEDVCERIRKRNTRGRDFSLIVVAEGAKAVNSDDVTKLSEEKDEFGNVCLGGIGQVIAEGIRRKLNYDTRVVNLGHVQRGGSPTAYDRILGTRLGVKALELVTEGQFGMMVSVNGDRLEAVELGEAVGKRRYVDDELYRMASYFFG